MQFKKGEFALPYGVLLKDLEIIQMKIKTPPARKKISALFFKSPHRKKLGASEATKYKYPPKAIDTKADNKSKVLKKPIQTTQIKVLRS